MNKYFTTLTNERGDVLPNYRAQVVDSTGSTVTIYSDKSGTRFTDASGNIVNYATASNNGRVSFYFTAEEGQILQTLDAAGNLVDSEPDFADNLILTNLPGNVPQSAVTDLTTDLAAKANAAEVPSNADLASTDAGKGAELVAGAGKTIATRAAMKALTNASDKARPLQLTEGVREGTFVWDSSDLSASVTLDAQEGIYIPPTSDPTGASGAWVRVFGESINARWFGATGDGVTDDTAALQAAIDYTVNTFADTVYVPAGRYVISTLVFNDTSTGTARADRGKFRFVGDGPMGFAEVYNNLADYGTVFLSNVVDGTHALQISEGGTNNRDVVIDGISVRYGGTGFALYCDYMPGVQIRNVTVGITSAAGQALFLRDTWYGIVDRLIAVCKSGVTSTAVGIEIDNSLFAGSLMFRDCTILHFNDNIYFDPSGNFANITFQNCTSERFNRYGLFCEAPIWNLTLRDYYTETGSGTNCIKIAPSGSVSNLVIDGAFFLGGTPTVQWLTAAAIDLTNVQQFRFSGIQYYQAWSSFLNVGSGVLGGSIDGIDVKHSAPANLPAGPLYMITGTMAKEGTVALSNKTITSSTKLAWFNSALHRVAKYDGTGSVMNALSLGPRQDVALSAGVYSWNAADPKPIVLKVTATGGGVSAVQMPSDANTTASDVRLVVNDPTSTQAVVLRTFGNVNIGYSVPVGGAALLLGDPATGKWLALPFSVGAYGP